MFYKNAILWWSNEQILWNTHEAYEACLKRTLLKKLHQAVSAFNQINYVVSSSRFGLFKLNECGCSQGTWYISKHRIPYLLLAFKHTHRDTPSYTQTHADAHPDTHTHTRTQTHTGTQADTHRQTHTHTHTPRHTWRSTAEILSGSWRSNLRAIPPQLLSLWWQQSERGNAVEQHQDHATK